MTPKDNIRKKIKSKHKSTKRKQKKNLKTHKLTFAYIEIKYRGTLYTVPVAIAKGSIFLGISQYRNAAEWLC